ncbi:MAG: biopolymer transporter ExbD [Elusimicrobia bacterium]|nr:biopolymer transporter ExbD [Elusimicrobiota bacterium]
MMPLGGRDELPSVISDVNVVPLADVSLVLLILLMVLSPMMTQEMLKVKVAATSQSSEAVPPEAQELVLVVQIRSQGMWIGAERFTSLGAFVARMTQVLSAREDRKVFVVPDPDVATGRIVHMLETLRGCGASSVALVQTDTEAPLPADPGPFSRT